MLLQSYWPQIKPLVVAAAIGLGILSLQIGIYYGFIYFGITKGMLPFALQSLIDWVLWDPQIFIFRLHAKIAISARLHDAALSTFAFLYSLSQKDWQGIKQLLSTQGLVTGITYLLKRSVGRLRPNGENTYSFPSGHTSGAFTGASYIHQRYGLIKALPAYFVASMVGCIRVHKLAHYPTDVLAGAGIAILTAYSIVRNHDRNKDDNPEILELDVTDKPRSSHIVK